MDQRIGGPSTEPFLIQYNRVKDRRVPYRDKLSTDPRRAGHTSYARLSRGGKRRRGKDPIDRLYLIYEKKARGRALFIVERMGSESKGFPFPSCFGSGPSRSFS